jgi:SMC interacting uncharacterized protein involved in chromosome segregation
VRKKQVSLLDVKTALKDARFRDSLPSSFKDDVAKFIDNPGCVCNVKFYRRLLREAAKQLYEYFPDKEIVEEVEEVKALAENSWHVINCHIDELDIRLSKFDKGRKQIAVTRYMDQVTVVINELVGDMNNYWTVVNCKVTELEERLKKLAPGRKQVAIARYGEKITVVVNELDVIY